MQSVVDTPSHNSGTVDLLVSRKDIYTQNGEDGVIGEIFSRIGSKNQLCCEFGAWDGVHYSNTRNLILGGWSGVLIEADAEKFRALCENYSDFPKVRCVNQIVDGHNLGSILAEAGVDQDLDFLSVDIDGLDYEVFEQLIIRPRVICIEVNGGVDPEAGVIPRDVAANNVGQSLSYFCEIAREKGYSLACYTGNAFFIRNDVNVLPSLTAAEAYREWLESLPLTGGLQNREWLYLMNLGFVPPFRRFGNPLLTRQKLGISLFKWPLFALRSLRYASTALLYRVRMRGKR